MGGPYMGGAIASVVFPVAVLVVLLVLIHYAASPLVIERARRRRATDPHRTQFVRFLLFLRDVRRNLQ